MSLLNVIAAESRKILTLPAAWIAAVVGFAGPVLLTVVTSNSFREAMDSGRTERVIRTSTIDKGFEELAFGIIGGIVLGAVIISSEYAANSDDAGGGRQIETTLIATPQRWTLIAAKVVVLSVVVAIMAAITVPTTLAISHSLLGTYATPFDGTIALRAIGAGLYWIFTALITFGITTLTRSGVIPLIVLIANQSLVSVTFLLARAGVPVRFSPDVAGVQMFIREYDAERMLDPIAGGCVTAAWAIGFVVIAGIVFTRRDA